MVHTSGAARVRRSSQPAMAAGTQVGAFHPLVAFADTERARRRAPRRDDRRSRATTSWRPSSPRWPRRSAACPVRLAPGAKAAYHAAAVLAAGGFVALLDAIAELRPVAGLDEAGALAIYCR